MRPDISRAHANYACYAWWAIGLSLTLGGCSSKSSCPAGSVQQGDRCTPLVLGPSPDGSCPASNPECDVCRPGCKLGEYCRAGSPATCVPYKVSQVYDLENIRSHRPPWDADFEYVWSGDALVVATGHSYPNQNPIDPGNDQYTIIRSLDVSSDPANVSEKWRRKFEPVARSGSDDRIWENGGVAAPSGLYVDNDLLSMPLVTRNWTKEGANNFGTLSSDVVDLLGVLPVFIDPKSGVVVNPQVPPIMVTVRDDFSPFLVEFYPIGKTWHAFFEGLLRPEKYSNRFRGMYATEYKFEEARLQRVKNISALNGLDTNKPISYFNVHAHQARIEADKVTMITAGSQALSQTLQIGYATSPPSLTPVGNSATKLEGYVYYVQISANGSDVKATVTPIVDEIRSVETDFAFFDINKEFVWSASRMSDGYYLHKVDPIKKTAIEKRKFADNPIRLYHAVYLNDREVLFAGVFEDTLRLSNTLVATSAGGSDVFVAIVDMNNQRIKFLKTFGSQKKDSVVGVVPVPVSVPGTSAYMIAARFGGAVDIGTGVLGNDENGVSLLWRMQP